MALENGRLRGDDLEAVLVLKWYESVRRRKCVLDASLLLPILHPSQSPLSRSLRTSSCERLCLTRSTLR